MKNSFLLFCITIFFITSCTPTKTIVDTSCSGYKSVDFGINDISAKRIAIMPILGGDEKEQFRRPMGDAITKYLRIQFGEDKILSPNEVISVLNEKNLSEKYSSAINNYSISGIVPKEMVNQLADALSVGYVLYVRLLSDSELGFVSSGYGIQTIKVDELYVQSQIWDTRIGDIVWEGKGGISKLDSNQSDIIEKTAEGLSKVIGTEKSFGPCEDKKELIKSVQTALMNTYLSISGVTLAVCLIIILAL